MRRSSQIIQMGPNTNDECPYKRRRGHGRADVKTEAEIRAKRPQGKDPWSPQQLEEAGRPLA